MQVAATFAADKPLGYEMNKEFSWTQTVRIASPEGEARALSCRSHDTPTIGSGTLPPIACIIGLDAWRREACRPQNSMLKPAPHQTYLVRAQAKSASAICPASSLALTRNASKVNAGHTRAGHSSRDWV